MESTLEARPKARMLNPTPYDDTDRVLFPQFFALLKAKMRYDSATWVTEAERVWYAYGCLTGKAATRVLPWMTTYADDEAAFNLDNFYRHLQSSFEDKAIRQKALNKLTYMKQGKREFGDLLSEFEQTLLEGGVSTQADELKISWLRNTLTSDLRNATVSVSTQSGYRHYCHELQQIAYRMSEDQKSDKRQRGRNIWTSSSRSPVTADEPYQAAPTPGDPMEIDGGNTRTYGVRTAQWVSKETLEGRRKAGECLRCGGGGHMIRHCPYAPAKPPQPRVGRVSQPLLVPEEEESGDQGKE
ncbi:hypothetical protein ACJ73_10279 [Blastomyces percursus]|uniref:CCHC-type domain-containing protein n=1 Tax=Blastomyces percursus TaxID=1658174 RepID=A0A1J9PNQ4_9EURO|nr:hypothetical protein ACJ73_10279 [Blastomyces percursus]